MTRMVFQNGARGLLCCKLPAAGYPEGSLLLRSWMGGLVLLE